MSPLPNELYTAFSFLGFVLCVIPLYWHIKAWNAGTCLYMIWTGLGCLLQCINSIVWNKNMINRVPVYCDISTHVQVALNVAVPATSLCINRQLYRVARMKTAGMTDVEKRRNLIYDLLIGIGIPVLQMISEYVISTNRYNIFEDYGPAFSVSLTPLTFVLFDAWPVAIGTVSLFYCIMAIYAFYKRRKNHLKLISNANRGQYIRLMAISSAEILGTVPLGTYYIVSSARQGVVPWPGWAAVHSHYSEVMQVAGFIWRNDPVASLNLELTRWSLVACAFIFFALFGLGGEARENYRRLYNWLARRTIGRSTSTPHGAPLASPPSVPYVKRNGGLTNPIMIHVSREKDSLSISSPDQPSVLSISMGGTLEHDSTTLQDSESKTVSSYTEKSFQETEMVHHCEPAPPPGLARAVRPLPVPPAPPPVFLPTARPSFVTSTPPSGIIPSLHPARTLPHLPDPTKTTMPVHASSGVKTVS